MGGGSKLNKTARSYKMLTQGAVAAKGAEFVRITDEKVWGDARRNLEETLYVMHPLYNISDLENRLFFWLFSQKKDPFPIQK